MFVTEALHPFDVFRAAGFDVDLVSETGSFEADWLSQQKDWLSGHDRKAWEDPQSDFRKKLDAHLKPADINPKEVSHLCSYYLPLSRFATNEKQSTGFSLHQLATLR